MVVRTPPKSRSLRNSAKASSSQSRNTTEGMPSQSKEDTGTTTGEQLGATYKVISDRHEESGSQCRACAQEVKDNQRAVQCDKCNLWFHIKCGNIDEAVYRVIEKATGFNWYCEECKSSMASWKEENKQLRKENNVLKEENSKLMEKLATLESRVSAIKLEIMGEMRAEMKETIENVYVTMREMEDKKIRENNLILYNVPESIKENSKERETDDRRFCQRLFEDGVQVSEYHIDSLIRLGKQGEKPRPLLAKLQSPQEKWSILKRARNLKHCQEFIVKKIVIAPDLSRKDREFDKKLRDELRAKRENGENDWYIKDKKLVKRENFQTRQ